MENNWGGWREDSDRKQSNRSKVVYISISAEALLII